MKNNVITQVGFELKDECTASGFCVKLILREYLKSRHSDEYFFKSGIPEQAKHIGGLLFGMPNSWKGVLNFIPIERKDGIDIVSITIDRLRYDSLKLYHIDIESIVNGIVKELIDKEVLLEVKDE